MKTYIALMQPKPYAPADRTSGGMTPPSQVRRTQTVFGVCSYRPRPSVQSSRSYMLKTGESAWGRDVWHISDGHGFTLCGRSHHHWLTIGETEIDWHCCKRCAEKAGESA